MALGLAGRIVQGQRQRLSPRTLIWVGLLTHPVGELREEVKKEIASNPAIDDVDVSPFFRRGGTVSSDDVKSMLENVAARGESLDEHLMSELRLAETDDRTRAIAELVIGELDETGRFIGSMPDLVMVSGVSEKEIDTARRFVMTLDPLGCGAKDTVECLTAQLVRIPAEDRADCRKVIERFDDLKSGKATLDGLDARTLAVFRKYRGRLTVNPGEGFAPRRDETVQPDISVDADGDFAVETGDLPEIRISTKYLQMAGDRSLDVETRKYAQERVRRAKDFAAAVQQRHETIERVAEAVFASQREFVRTGKDDALKPLTMTEVAKRARCSIATISRTAHRKYVKTPHGTVPFRRFFTVVDHAPLAKLREVLSAPGASGLSDREVAERLSAAGCTMARRTVNKYRRKFLGDNDKRKEKKK